MIGNEELELVEEYTCLGQMVSGNPAHEKEIRRRIGMGWSAFGKQNLVMNSNLPLSLNRNVYNQWILPVLTYGSETWRLSKELERKLRSAQRGMERRMLGITWRDREQASWIREQTKVKGILMTIKNKKWIWAGHIMWRRDNRFTTRATEWQPRNGRWNQARQRVTWRDEIKGFPRRSWSSLTSDKERWKMLGKAFVLQWTSNGWIWSYMGEDGWVGSEPARWTGIPEFKSPPKKLPIFQSLSSGLKSPTCCSNNLHSRETP